MPKNKSIKEDRNNNSDGNIDVSFTPVVRGKRDRDSGSEGSPNISKKPLKSNMVSETLYAGVAEVVSGEQKEKGVNITQNDNYSDKRKQFIENQLKNRYNTNSLPPFVVFVEGNGNPNSEDINIGNLHPMAIARSICMKCGDDDIVEIRSIGKIIQEVTFKSFNSANDFVNKKDRLDRDWLIYIPNFKVRRTGVMRGVDPSLSVQDVIEGLSWPGNPLKVIEIERLKFKVRGSEEIRSSASIKIVIETDLLPEYLSLWKRRVRVSPSINRVRKCVKCAKWGHSANFCRGSRACGKCGDDHDTSACYSMAHKCVNCGGDHDSFYHNCKVLIRHKIINIVMAYANVSRFKALKLIKFRNIISVEQAENVFKTQAFKGWEKRDLDLVSMSQRDRIYNKNKDNRNNRKSDTGSGMSLPVITSSRYLSCIESPSGTNMNSVISPQEPHLSDIVTNKEMGGSGKYSSTKGSPIEESAPLEDHIVAGRNKDLINRQEVNGYLSEIYFIMQQQNKTWKNKLKEVLAMTEDLANT